MDVLNYTPPSPSERMIAALRADLDAGMPLHMVQQKLLSGGMDADNARQFVGLASEMPLGHCPKCKFYFRRTVHTCSGCGGSLNTYNG